MHSAWCSGSDVKVCDCLQATVAEAENQRGRCEFPQWVEVAPKPLMSRMGGKRTFAR
jgi:hypothetical protein